MGREEEKANKKKVHILGFAGSLRKGSFNRAFLRATLDLVPANADLEIFDLEGIPPFSQDLEDQMPDKVKAFKTKIRAADAILIATPEHNYPVSGVLKNAIDWGSRPFGNNSFDEKPVAIMGVSVGVLGTVRTQYHLRQIFVFLNLIPLNRPEVMVPFVQDKIDQDGKVTDSKTREKIKELVESLVTWTKKMQGE